VSLYSPVFHLYAETGLYDLEEMCESDGVLNIRLALLKDASRRLVVSFSNHLAFRKTGESEGLVMLNAIATTSQPGLSFYVVEDSDYLRWLVEQSHGIQETQKLTHFAIITIDDIIDVITLELPSVSVID
jgi:hypothetical protein